MKTSLVLSIQDTLLSLSLHLWTPAIVSFLFYTLTYEVSRHSDELVQLCVDSKESFGVIGVSEIWSSEQSKILTNIDISGYKFYETSSTSQNGGVGLYVKTNLNSRSCDDLN